MDPLSLAVAAVAVVTPYLVASGEGTDDKAPDAARAVWNWVKARLASGADRAAVLDAEAAPTVAENAQALQAALTKVLRKDSGAAATLAKLLNDRAASR